MHLFMISCFCSSSALLDIFGVPFCELEEECEFLENSVFEDESSLSLLVSSLSFS